MSAHRRFAALCCALAGGSAALAQEAMYTEAATMPSPGVFILRPQVTYSRFDAEPDGSATQTERIEWSTSLQVGLDRDLSFRADVPLAWERESLPGGGHDSDHGVEDIDLMVKWRIYKDDSGGIDTLRIALIGGAFVASGDDKDFSTQTVNPHLGAVATMVRGRHGFNQEITYQFNTGGTGVDNLGGGMGPSDALASNTAYLYRIAPDAFTAESRGAWYVTAELNALFEMNGDSDLRFSPGVMYEGWSFAFEIMAQLPVWQDLDRRAELDFSVGVGLRFTF